MGLLTNDKSVEDGTLVKLVKNHANKLSVLSFVLALVAAAALVTENYVDTTYFSDNALLPGLVNREFTANQYLKGILEKLNSETAKSDQGEFIADWLLNEFNSIGLNAAVHNFTLHYPFDREPALQGKNVYGILRTSRAPSTEALVLSSPYRTSKSVHGSTLPGIALMLSLAKHFAKKNYLAKDLIFLVGDKDLIGFQAWLDAYHEVDPTPVLNYGFLEVRSGPIQAAVNLEVHEEDVTSLEIKIEGLNGQLPNLDLFNVAVELATRESVTPTLHGRSHPFSADFYEVATDYATTTASMMISQAKSIPTGAHGLFHKYAIQALTLEGVGKKSRGHLSVPFYQVGRVVEGIFRSLNNLLERFNRSYWFYLLPSTRRYISIGYYMIPFGLMAITLLIKALNIYLSMRESKGKVKGEDDTDSSESLWNGLPFNFYCQIFGLISASMPGLIQRYSWAYRGNDLTFKDSLYYSLISLSALLMFSPLVMWSKTSSEQLKTRQCIALINLALILSCLSLLNISMALFLTLVMVPVAYLSVSISNRFIRKLLLPFVLLLHPLSLSYLCLLGLSIWFDPTKDPLIHLDRSFSNHKSTLLNYIEDWYIHGNWAFLFGSAFLFPAWLQLWSIL